MKLLIHKYRLYIILSAILLILNIIAFRFINNQIRSLAYNRVKLATHDLSFDIQRRIISYSSVLKGGAALFAASSIVTPDEWHKYFTKLEISKNYPGIQTVAYAPVVKPGDLDAFVNQQKRDNGIDIKIYPNKPTLFYVPVTYIDPLTNDVKKVLGFNIYSEPNRQSALTYAMENNSIAVTNKIIPVADVGKPKPGVGFVMVAPVYKNGAPIDTVEQRRDNIEGFVTAGVRPERLMGDIKLNVIPGLKYQIFDDSDNGDLSESSLLFNSGDSTVAQTGYAPLFSLQDDISWPNIKWHVRYIAISDFGLAKIVSWAPYGVLAFDLLLSILLLILIHRLINRFQTMKGNEDKYYQQVLTEDAVVDSFQRAIIATNTHGIINLLNRKAEQILGYSESELVYEKNFLDIIDQQSLQKHITRLGDQLKIPLKADFDSMVTRSIIDGKDEISLQFNSKTGRILYITLDALPLYGLENKLLGYQFIFR